MLSSNDRTSNRRSAAYFAIGFSLVMLTIWVPFIPAWNTFIHMWRVELAASIFLFAAISFILYTRAGKAALRSIYIDELKLVILPVLAFIVWSSASVLWAPSWSSALHHTLVWCLYLAFYLIVRRLVEHKENYNILITIFAVTLVLFSLPAIIDYCLFLVYGGSTLLGIRFAKHGEQVNTIFPLLVVGVLCLKERRFVFGTVALAAIWLLVFCSLSRINLFLFMCGALAIAAVIYFLGQFKEYRRKMTIVLAALVLAPLPLHLFSLLSEDANIPMVRRVSDEASISSSNNFRGLMATLSLEMFRDQPVVGIGADNFGMQVNRYRAAYGERNPDDVNLATAEENLPERAHNEYLQILAELGVVGGLIFLWLLSGIALMMFRALRKPISLIPLAAMIGVGLFLVSSLVSSYSFRLIQNGLFFFFALAVAAKTLLRPKEEQVERLAVPKPLVRFACVLGMAACLLLSAYSIIRVTSVYFAEKANSVENIDEAIPVYERAFRLDEENPNVHFYLGNRLFHAGRYAEAASHLRMAIDMGQAASPTFSYLASAHLLAGDLDAAERTFAGAVKLYPRSPFVLTRYSFFLKLNNKPDESANWLKRAEAIDKGSARTWWTIMNDGTQHASDNVLHNNELRPIMDLRPNQAIYAVITERELRFPGEKIDLPF